MGNDTMFATAPVVTEQTEVDRFIAILKAVAAKDNDTRYATTVVDRVVGKAQRIFADGSPLDRANRLIAETGNDPAALAQAVAALFQRLDVDA